MQDYETGVRAVQEYKNDYGSEERTEMMESCSCQDFDALMRFETRKGSSRRTVIDNKYNAVFDEWHQIARGSSYARDMDEWSGHHVQGTKSLRV